jgi:hypothetical protein
MLCSSKVRHRVGYLEDGGGMFLRNAGSRMPGYTVSRSLTVPHLILFTERCYGYQIE